jgi:ferrochelatase
MRHNYAAIGGRSPLTDLTLGQAAALRSRLGDGIPVAVGMRNWRPFIKDAVEELAGRGVTRIIGIPMAPQFSTLSVQKYIDAARTAIASQSRALEFESVRSFHAHPLLIEAFTERLRAAAPAPDELVIFTAHSLPARVVENGDAYANEVEATARAVAATSGCTRYEIAYQSAGRTAEPWLGPSLDQLIEEQAGRGARRFLVAPLGFVCDHTEILYDVDVQAAETARRHGATLRRTESLNTSPTFIRMLEDIVRGMM